MDGGADGRGVILTWDEALAGTPGRAGGWLDVLAVFAVLYVAIGIVAFGPLLEDG